MLRIQLLYKLIILFLLAFSTAQSVTAQNTVSSKAAPDDLSAVSCYTTALVKTHCQPPTSDLSNLKPILSGYKQAAITSWVLKKRRPG